MTARVQLLQSNPSPVGDNVKPSQTYLAGICRESYTANDFLAQSLEGGKDRIWLDRSTTV